ncbi:hypothetical protein [Rugamonas sp. DEMB1]|uniref:hypothetical protein n=1 Tax=Rugamonas sp. DEMB1 TaxID=3039386 RepID=UPI00244D2039|nr:hypothetical protein [Rugamonas sp. DEMB1]WGG50085.1 hypothetical protein QC826_27165 [Rugamonas sp. DEMB1]
MAIRSGAGTALEGGVVRAGSRRARLDGGLVGGPGGLLLRRQLEQLVQFGLARGEVLGHLGLHLLGVGLVAVAAGAGGGSGVGGVGGQRGRAHAEYRQADQDVFANGVHDGSFVVSIEVCVSRVPSHRT